MTLSITGILTNWDILVVGLGLGIVSGFFLSYLFKIILILVIVAFVFGIPTVMWGINSAWSLAYSVLHSVGVL